MDRTLLARATEQSDAPTPGYMYMDIAKNAASNPSTCAEIGQYLTRRLASKQNHNVKFKCLKVISKTAVSPYLRGQFKRYFSQNPAAVEAIKEALQFRGNPDPVRGDEPFQKVRTAAKEALDAIYSDTPADQSSGGGGAPFATSVSTNYGASPNQQYGGNPNQGAASAGSSYPGSSGRRMEGIGNPMFKDHRLEPQQGNLSVNEMVREARETVVGMIKDPLARGIEAQANNHRGSVPRPGGSYGGSGGGGGGFSAPPPGRSDLMQQSGGQWSMASNRGPDAHGTPQNYDRDAAYHKAQQNGSNAYAWAQREGGATSSGPGGSWGASSVAAQARQPAYQQHQATPSISVNSAPPSHHAGSGGTALSDGSYEKQLIMELCPPGGMKAEPPPDRLAQFARTVANLNADLVCPALLDCLEDGQPWIIRAKALCVIETCVRHGQKPGTGVNPYADFFHACHDEVAPLVNHARAAIRDPAKRVLILLGFAASADAAAPVAAARPPAAAPAAPVANLLDFDDNIITAPTPAPAPPPPAVPDGGSLFGGLKVVQGGAAAPAAALPTAPPPAPTSGNLLDGFMTAAAPAPPAAAAGGDLFGEMNVKENAAPAPAPASVGTASSMFDNMSVKSPAPAVVDDSVSLVGSGGSGFGFMNDFGANDASEKKVDVPVAPVSAASFDPLKNVTPNTAKQMMQLSPQQMQAMAYQQIMMQQQMQMSQMQARGYQQQQPQMMGMQQQQQQQQRGGGGGVPGNFMQGPYGHGQAVMQNPAAAKTSFAFLDPGQSQKKDDKSFDFIKDTMKMQKK